MKDPFAPYIHLFLLFESLSFLLIQGSARILAGGLTQRKEATFCQQRGYFLVHGPATLPISQIASLQHHVSFSFSFFFKFVESLCFHLHLFPAHRIIRALAIPWKVSPSRASFFHLPPFPSVSLFLSPRIK